jgi:predicted transcriptional regulator
MVFNIIRARGNATIAEIAALTGLQKSSVSGRMGDLRRHKKILNAGKRKCMSGKGMAIMWVENKTKETDLFN